MRAILAVPQLLLLLTFAAADAQSDAPARAEPGVHLSLTGAISAPNGGWGWGEAARTAGIRAAVPVARRTQVWLSAQRAELNMYVCADVPPGCPGAGTPYLVHAGLGYRAGPDTPGRVVPFAGAGFGVEHWSGGSHVWTPHIHGGIDWVAFRHLALRLEAQSEWQHPARVGSGLVVRLR